MKKNKPKPKTRTIDLKAEKRKKALELYNNGYSQTQISKFLNISQSSVSLWIKKARLFGLEALQTKYSPGAPSKLSTEQKQILFEILGQKPTDFGFISNTWTRKLVAQLIRQTFNISYDLSQISRILKSFNKYKASSNNINSLLTTFSILFDVLNFS